MICPKPTGVQVMAATVVEEDTETIPDIYGSGGVFDNIDQQVIGRNRLAQHGRNGAVLCGEYGG